MAAERELRQRDLPVALTPAAVDILLVAGLPAPAMAHAVDRLWHGIAEPRARADFRTAGEVAAALGECAPRLSDPAGNGTVSGADDSQAHTRHVAREGGGPGTVHGNGGEPCDDGDGSEHGNGGHAGAQPIRLEHLDAANASTAARMLAAGDITMFQIR